MVRKIYRGGGMAELIYTEDVLDKERQMKTIRLYARDLLAEIKLIAIAALFIFGAVFAVPMVRHEAVYILYWAMTTLFTAKVLLNRYRPKKKNRNRARTATPRH